MLVAWDGRCLTIQYPQDKAFHKGKMSEGSYDPVILETFKMVYGISPSIDYVLDEGGKPAETPAGHQNGDQG